MTKYTATFADHTLSRKSDREYSHAWIVTVGGKIVDKGFSGNEELAHKAAAGYAVRSRASKLGKRTSTVGAARQKIAEIAQGEPEIIAFVARVEGHVLVIGRDGQTLVDTDPRKNDRRKLRGLVAVF